MKVVLSHSAYALLASSSVTIAAWRLMQWRARKRSRFAADRVQQMAEPGPMINLEDKKVCENIVNSAIRRASKWIAYQINVGDASVMVGQVGGVSVHKRPLLTLEPDYVMKPVQTDHRGMREIFLYEAVKVLSKNRSSQQYATLLTDGHSSSSSSNSSNTSRNNLIVIDLWDTLALWLAMKMNDPIVTENERRMNQSWKIIKKEVDTLRRLATFIPSYYGVVGQRSPLSIPEGEEKANRDYHGDKLIENGNEADGLLSAESHFGISLEAHLLFSKLTSSFSKPCVMDLKMGTQTYEPDAPEDKKLRESAKYPQQDKFGFRIVGMRFYEPNHPEADEQGFRYFDKSYGRSLETKEEVLKAFRLFLSAGCLKSPVSSSAQEGEVLRNGENSIPANTSSLDESANNTHGNTPALTEQDMAAKEQVRIRAVSSILAQLRPIMGFFEENKSLAFHASSLLIVYEGDRDCTNPDVTSVKMIDFGRVRRQPGGDPGYRLGLKTLKTYMDKIHKEEKQRFS